MYIATTFSGRQVLSFRVQHLDEQSQMRTELSFEGRRLGEQNFNLSITITTTNATKKERLLVDNTILLVAGPIAKMQKWNRVTCEPVVRLYT